MATIIGHLDLKVVYAVVVTPISETALRTLQCKSRVPTEIAATQSLFLRD